MDQSDTYCKMCKNPILQDQWEKVVEGDWVWWSEQRVVEIMDSSTAHAWPVQEVRAEKGFWLPSQDQTQAMLFEGHCCNEPECLLLDFKKFVINQILPIIEPTFEKYWLMMYMRKTHCLHWVDEIQEWIHVPEICPTCGHNYKSWHRLFHVSKARYCSNPWHQY